MGTVFLKVLNMGFTASWLILAVMVLRLVLKKAPKWISCFLWALVAVKLVCPFSLESAWSLIPSSEPLPENMISENTFQVNTGISLVDAPVNEYLDDHYYEGVTVPADNGNNMMQTAGLVWMAGVILLLLYSIFSYYRLHKQTRVCVNLKENIFLCDAIDTPFILGIVKPRIYLPSALDKEQTEYVIAHEKAHLQRRDHWWKPLGFVILSVYWFHPLCWLSYILLCRDIELACDERVIRRLGGESKKPYAEALLSCSVKQSMVTACPLAFGEVGVKERVKNVLHYKKPAFWIVLGAILCCIIAAACFLTDPKQEDGLIKEENQESESLEQANTYAGRYAQETYQEILGSESDYDYTDWRVQSLEHCYTYEELEGKRYEIYRFDFQFQSASPEKVVLTGGMTVSEDGWVTPDYPGSRYVVMEKDGEEQEFVAVMVENDCYPGDEIFTEDLLAFVREKEESQDTASYSRQAELQELLDSWRKAFVERDGEGIADMAAPALAGELLEGSEGSYSFGVSSPWPVDWETDSVIYYFDEGQAELYYYARTSDPHITCWKETLTYERKNDRYVITGEELKCYDEISDGTEFEEAYYLSVDGTMMDYTWNGLGEALNENALLSSSTVYRDLFEPESAAAFLLNLSDDTSKVRYTLHEPESPGMVGLDIVFSEDGLTEKVSMIQPYGENGIWVPVNYRVDVVSRFSKVPWNQVKNLRFTGSIPDLNGIVCIGEIPEKSIKLYGYNDEEVGARGVAVAMGEDVNYFDWVYTSPQTIPPDLYWDEANRQLQISFHIYTGTGASADSLYVLQQYDTGTLQENKLDLNDYERLLEERISYRFEEKTRELILTDNVTKEELARATVSEEEGSQVAELELGMISDFELGEKIYFCVTPGYYMDDMIGIAEYEDMPELRFEVVMTQGEDGSIRFDLGDKIS